MRLNYYAYLAQALFQKNAERSVPFLFRPMQFACLRQTGMVIIQVLVMTLDGHTLSSENSATGWISQENLWSDEKFDSVRDISKPR